MPWPCSQTPGAFTDLPLGLTVNSTLSVAEPIAVPGCTQNSQPPCDQGCKPEFVLLEPTVTHQAPCFIIGGDARYRNLSFTLERMSPQGTDYWTSKNFTKAADP